jgi:hypothetical protein
MRILGPVLAAILSLGCCGCGEIWSVAEELGSGLVSDDSPAAATASAAGPETGPNHAEPEPAPGAEEPADLARNERFGLYLAELCMRMRRGNSSYVEQHVDLPIEVRLRDEDESGNPRYRDQVFDNAYDLRMSGICADLTWLGAAIEVSEGEGGWTVLASGNGSSVELEFRRTRKGRPKLTRYRQL